MNVSGRAALIICMLRFKQAVWNSRGGFAFEEVLLMRRGKMRPLVIMFLLLGTLALAGSDYKPVVHIDGIENFITLIPGKSSQGDVHNAGWKNQQKEYYVEFTGKVLKEGKWEKYTFWFTPKSDGEVVLSFRATWNRVKGTEKIEPIWIFYDEIKVAGAKLENEDFSKKDEAGLVKFWQVNKQEQFVAEGKKTLAEVWFSAPISQKIQLKKGKKVKISFKVKSSHVDEVKPGA